MPANKPTRAKVRKADKSKNSVALPQEFSDRLDHLARLPQNWDSYGAVPISPEVVKKARAIVLRVLALGGENIPLPFVAPSPDGGIELEWKTTSNKELILDIPPVEGHMAFLLVEPTESGDEVETEGKIGDPYTLQEVVGCLLSR